MKPYPEYDRIILEHILESPNSERIHVYNPCVIPSYISSDEKEGISVCGELTVVSIDKVCDVRGP